MTMCDKDNKHPSEYLNDLEEWQNNQYNPGHWTGGRIPFHLKYPKKRLGVFFIVIGIVSLALMGFSAITDPSTDTILNNIIVLLAGLIFLAAGFRIILSKK